MIDKMTLNSVCGELECLTYHLKYYRDVELSVRQNILNKLHDEYNEVVQRLKDAYNAAVVKTEHIRMERGTFIIEHPTLYFRIEFTGGDYLLNFTFKGSHLCLMSTREIERHLPEIYECIDETINNAVCLYKEALK